MLWFITFLCDAVVFVIENFSTCPLPFECETITLPIDLCLDPFIIRFCLPMRRLQTVLLSDFFGDSFIAVIAKRQYADPYFYYGMRSAF